MASSFKSRDVYHSRLKERGVGGFQTNSHLSVLRTGSIFSRSEKMTRFTVIVLKASEQAHITREFADNLEQCALRQAINNPSKSESDTQRERASLALCSYCRS